MMIKLLASSAIGFALMGSSAIAQTYNNSMGDICAQEYVSQIIYYEFNKPQSAETLSQIQNIQNIASTCNVQNVTLTGHTDTSGSSAYNQTLSVRRANNVKADLIELGMNGNIVSTQGRGETELFIPTADGVKEALNRRVEVSIHLVPVVQEVTEVYQEPVYQEPVYQEPVYQEPVYVEPTPAPAPEPVYVEPTPAPAPVAAPRPVPVSAPSTGGLNGLFVIGAVGAAGLAAILLSDDDNTPTSP